MSVSIPLGPLTLQEVRRCGLTLAELARICQISYMRLYRAATGTANTLTNDELTTIRHVMAVSRDRGALPLGIIEIAPIARA